MSIVYEEKPMIVNGSESWIRCVERFEEPGKPGSPVKYHYHDYVEVLYALDSDGYVWINGEKHRYETGTLMIVNPKEPHALTFDSQSHHLCVQFLPHILYSDEKSFYEFKYVAPFLLEDTHQYVFNHKEISTVNIGELMIEILDEWKRQGTAYELIIRANILKIISGVFRYWDKNKIFFNVMDMNETMKTALSYISENYKTLTQKEVAEKCNVSYQYLSRMFKKSIGKGMNEYISFLRLKEAEKMLISTNKSITDIAMDCGFFGTSYFIERFKKYSGITPKKFREKCR